MSDPLTATADEVARRMAELGQRYLDRTLAELTELQTLITSAGGGDAAAFRNVEMLAHRIRGSGAMFGFDLVSDVASEIELLAVDAKLGLHPDRIALQARFAALLRVLAFVLHAARK